MVDSRAIDSAVPMFLGIPYRHGGRTKDGLDCLGLVYLFYQQLGVRIPDGDGTPYPADWYKKDAGRLQRGIETLGNPVSLSDLKPLDLVYFKIGGLISHLGVVVKPGKFIHVMKDRKVEVSPLNLFWRRYLAGARRLV